MRRALAGLGDIVLANIFFFLLFLQKREDSAAILSRAQGHRFDSRYRESASYIARQSVIFSLGIRKSCGESKVKGRAALSKSRPNTAAATRAYTSADA